MINKIREALNKELDKWKRIQLDETQRLNFLLEKNLEAPDTIRLEMITSVIKDIEDLQKQLKIQPDILIKNCKLTRCGIMIDSSISSHGIHINIL